MLNHLFDTLPFDVAVPIEAAINGGREIMDVYSTNTFQVSEKSDNTPLTIADSRSNKAIVEALQPAKFPVLSEEGAQVGYDERQLWDKYWLVDPLDGTKEFIKRNGQFAINIAFIKSHEPCWGLIFIPVEGEMYFGGKDLGLFKIQLPSNWAERTNGSIMAEASPCLVKELMQLPIPTIVASRSHYSSQTDELLATLKEKYPVIDLLNVGSAIKQVWVATGRAHLYPRFGTTMEWDTAAGHALVQAMGGDIVGVDDRLPLRYNKKELKNPNFFCVSGDRLAQDILGHLGRWLAKPQL